MKYFKCNFFIFLIVTFISVCATADSKKISFTSFEASDICVAVNQHLEQWFNDYPLTDIKGLKFYGVKNTEEEFSLPDEILGALYENFDFDNDGVEDYVFYYAGSGGYLSGSVIYVKYGNAKNTEAPKRKLLASEVKNYLCELDSNPKTRGSCEPVPNDFSGAQIQVKSKNSENIIFTARFTEIKPFNYYGKTYILLRGMDWTTETSWAVIKLKERSNFSTECVFKKKT